MNRYFVSMYTDGPATRWNVIDRQTQEWIRRFATEKEAQDHADVCEAHHNFKSCNDSLHRTRRRVYR